MTNKKHLISTDNKGNEIFAEIIRVAGSYPAEIIIKVDKNPLVIKDRPQFAKYGIIKLRCRVTNKHARLIMLSRYLDSLSLREISKKEAKDGAPVHTGGPSEGHDTSGADADTPCGCQG